MYRLAAFEATNISGFKSGLGRKTFRLDLHDLLWKDIIVILGDNATGKSTFLSLIHPSHTPSNKKPRFVIEGKEGVIVKEYVGDDGTSIITKAIYTPKGDSHVAKLYFKMVKGDSETELNPSGNVTSYYELVNTYFGINKDYIQFASYSDMVKGIVTMTDTERKLSVSTLVPNTNRYELAYKVINEKYRDLSNVLRSLSQKIIHLGNEDVLKHQLKKFDKEINECTEVRNEKVKEASRLEGGIREIVGDSTVKEFRKKHQKTNDRMIHLTASMVQQLHTIDSYCRRLSLKPVTEQNLLQIASELIDKIPSLQEKLKNVGKEVEKSEREVDKYRSRIADIDNQISNHEATMFSLQHQSIEDLLDIKNGLIERINGMEYSSHKDEYVGMTYDEAEGFISSLGLISDSVDAAFENYGQLVNEWFSGNDRSLFMNAEQVGTIRMNELSALQEERERVYQRIATLQSNAGLKQILDKRPATCVDDSCPFIKNALKWVEISKEIDEEMKKYDSLKTKIDSLRKGIEEMKLRSLAYQSLTSLQLLIFGQSKLFEKYFHISIDEIYRILGKGKRPEIFNLDEIKRIAAVLSEKTLYDKIVDSDLPNIDRQIKLTKSLSNNQKVLMEAIERLRNERDRLSQEIATAQGTIKVSAMISESYRGKIETAQALSECIDEYTSYSDEYNTLERSYDDGVDLLAKLENYSARMEEDAKEVDDLNKRIKEIVPIRDRIYFDLKQLTQLNLEKAYIDREFLIISMLKKIVGPGKGVWKEAIDIYMQDINATANQLLLHMFDGNLSLNDFVIDDKKFIIPYTFNGSVGPDISCASSSQQTTISNAISLAIIGQLLDRYGILTFDEVDKDLSPYNKEIFVKILATQLQYIGIQQCFIITHNPDYYESYGPGYICFPGSKAPKDADAIYI